MDSQSRPNRRFHRSYRITLFAETGSSTPDSSIESLECIFTRIWLVPYQRFGQVAQVPLTHSQPSRRKIPFPPVTPYPQNQLRKPAPKTKPTTPTGSGPAPSTVEPLAALTVPHASGCAKNHGAPFAHGSRSAPRKDPIKIKFNPKTTPRKPSKKPHFKKRKKPGEIPHVTPYPPERCTMWWMALTESPN